MVGLLLVSHSKKLAESVRQLVLQMTTPNFPVAVAAGLGDHFDQLGTDAVHIADVLQKLNCPEGVLVLMDLGSAVLSAETALELLEQPGAGPIRLCPAPLVEGAIAAAARAQAGGSLDEVAREAELGLAAKQQHLQSDNPVELPPTETQPLTTAPGETAELVLTIDNQYGLHARPAAALVRTAALFSCAVEVSNLRSKRGPASARSLTSLALLQIRKGDRIRVICSGVDCQAALKAIRELAAAGFGDAVATAPTVTQEMAKRAPGARSFPGSDGIAIGPLALLQTQEIPDDEQSVGDAAAELAKLKDAMKSVSGELQQASSAGTSSGAILEAQALILGDPVVLTELQSVLQRSPTSAARAWAEVTRALAAQYEGMDDPYLRERAADVRDIARRVFRRLKGKGGEALIRLAHPAILYTDELLPSEAAGCDPTMVLGVIAAKGSATSHSAIILRTLGVPMVVGARDIGEASAGKVVAMDGSTGEIWIDPGPDLTAKLEHTRQLQHERRSRAEVSRSQPSITLDGTPIEVLANVGTAHDSATAADNGADGVGLLRTEFLFVSRRQAPTEEQQVLALREIYAPIAGPVIVRTLDVGADKPLPFLPQADEHNPYLGVRGIRLSLQSPELFVPHLRAILRSGVGHDIWLMFPMISLAREVEESLRLLEDAHQQLQTEKAPHIWPIKRGIMIEVPSAALLAEQLAAHLDFFSIGTNDLTQYTMAAERGNAAVAELQDTLHPAVLRLMKSVVDGARPHHRHVSVCGDAASDTAAAAIFAGLGIRSLSVRPNRTAEIKAMFRELQFSDLESIAGEALQCHDAAEVRTLVSRFLEGVSRDVGIAQSS